MQGTTQLLFPAPEKKAALDAAIAKVQTELTASNSLINANASAQAYADQRERLSKSVDDMMATLTAAGFTGNTTVNGAPAVYAQLMLLLHQAQIHLVLL